MKDATTPTSFADGTYHNNLRKLLWRWNGQTQHTRPIVLNWLELCTLYKAMLKSSNVAENHVSWVFDHLPRQFYFEMRTVMGREFLCYDNQTNESMMLVLLWCSFQNDLVNVDDKVIDSNPRAIDNTQWHRNVPNHCWECLFSQILFW